MHHVIWASLQPWRRKHSRPYWPSHNEDTMKIWWMKGWYRNLSITLNHHFVFNEDYWLATRLDWVKSCLLSDRSYLYFILLLSPSIPIGGLSNGSLFEVEAYPTARVDHENGKKFLSPECCFRVLIFTTNSGFSPELTSGLSSCIKNCKASASYPTWNLISYSTTIPAYWQKIQDSWVRGRWLITQQ